MHKIDLTQCEDANFPTYKPSQIPAAISVVEPISEHMGVKIGDRYQRQGDRPFRIFAFGRLRYNDTIVFITDDVTWAGMSYLYTCTKLT